MPDEDDKILKYVSRKKSLRVPFAIYVDLECLLPKIDSCSNNPDKSYTEKKAKHRPSGYSMVLCCSFDKSKNEHEYYRGKVCMKKYCDDLKEQVIKIINYKKKELIPLTDEEKESYENRQFCHICMEEFCTDEDKKKEFKLKQKVKDHRHYTRKYRKAAHSICNLGYEITKEIHVVFHNGSTYDYHFIIKQLAREFNGYFHCLGENTEKYITFSVPTNKVLDNDNDSDSDNNNNNNKFKTVTYRLKFIDSVLFISRFLQDSLSKLVDNLPEINNNMTDFN